MACHHIAFYIKPRNSYEAVPYVIRSSFLRPISAFISDYINQTID